MSSWGVQIKMWTGKCEPPPNQSPFRMQKWSFPKLVLITKHHPVHFIQYFQNHPSESATKRIGYRLVGKTRSRCVRTRLNFPSSSINFPHISPPARGFGVSSPSEDWRLLSRQSESILARWFKVTFLSSNWRSLDPLKGHLTIPKRSLWITRWI